MKKIMKRVLSLLLVFVMLFGVLPTNTFAAGPSNVERRTLKLNEEQEFLLANEDHQVRFTYTAETAGTYIFYFRDLTSNTIDIGWTMFNIEYYHDPDDGHFEGRVVEMNAGETYEVIFEVSEGYAAYGATVGMKRLATDFTGFYSKNGFDEENKIIDVELGQVWFRPQFFTDDRFCYGVEWSTISNDPSIVDINQDATESTGVEYIPMLELKSVGETEITFKGVYGGKTVEKTYTIRVHEGGSPQPGPSFSKEFHDVDELLALIDQHGSGEFYYNSQNPLVIDKDVYFPGGSRLEAHGCKVIIDSDVTVQVDNLNCKELEVRGQLIANEGIGVEKLLTVDGELVLYNNFLDMEYPATINGLDHVNFREEYQKIVMNVRFDSASKLADMIDHVEANGYKDRKVEHIYRFQKEDAEARDVDLVIDKDITIAESDRLELFDFRSVTVAAGKTLTINGDVGIDAPVTVNGCLTNNGMVDVSYRNNGRLILTEDDSYAGDGELIIHCYDQADFEKCFVPKTRDDFDYTYDVDWGDGCYHYHVRHVAGLIKLGTPYELRWDSKKAGYMSWKTKRPDQSEAEVKIYKRGEKQPCYQGRFGFGEDYVPEIRTIDLFAESDLGSGTYYFTVQSLGDYKTYRNSDIAVSGYYTYFQPNKKLTECTELQWFDKNDMYASWVTWTAPMPARYVDGYQVQFYYCDTPNGDYICIGGLGGRSGNASFVEEPLHDHFIQNGGEGYYKFQVRALSNDITKYCNSQWSDFSPVLDLKKVPQDITNDLDNLLNQNLPAQDVIDQVQAMDTADLKKTLLTDQESQGATEVLKQLENQVGGAANVVVTKDASAFDANKVSIVGANLNNKDDENESITLEIDKPEKQHVIHELYKSSVAVRFSMTLDNVEDPKNLEVPVKISLPIPENINPEFLVILHYHVDGTHETIVPYIHDVDGTLYADFVLTSFSDFIITEKNIVAVVEPEEEITDVSDVFPDVEDNAWYEAGIQFVYDRGIMMGSEGFFKPTSDITRAQIVTTLYRLIGSPEVEDRAALIEFSDVAEGEYYTDAVCWAYATGITTGTDGKFNPHASLTRQQMATFFFRFAEYNGMDTEVRGSVGNMLNADKVSDYAKNAVEWAVGAGLIKGSEIVYEDGSKVYDLNPTGKTTRAQVATILMRFCSE